MNATQRRDEVIEILKNSKEPISANQLSNKFSVSRQVIVGDIALIRAFGIDVFATPRGYLLKCNEENDNKIVKTIACKHDKTGLEKEIYCIVDNGGGLIDVIVEHPLYGDLTGPLHIFSRYDADEFIKKIREQNVKPLSLLTDGIHLHTISCPNEVVLNRILEVLKDNNILL
ncbi:transcription repressor NadR [Sedimentibacter sp. zth1]|uniref:transcription repressor NadR n=1 Tax=Sedimentibacter sp. zth1 TaxID=2816908 RepID=UPI001A93709C|nr:transcription repressor NadR [Sedimentibacter sp. zth1]QSX05836.1 transcription repressor NadR [Sedimentibacter sp. zth1]